MLSCIDLVDLLADTKLNDDEVVVEEIPQPNRGNKTSKKNKKKNKNQQDFDENSAGTPNNFACIFIPNALPNSYS